ncbi:hypothetical protein DM02DRAFT_614111 [Periconia macrospinosa]|uniref:Uncharacterized protein n=1 Tax=Periconia macrospinosa TaxID=97972 RepID=A0A2V1DS75_9PLEO|nr:hypothetical protein DM02DRAFT_614111 [Periconia macrospinosa]
MVLGQNLLSSHLLLLSHFLLLLPLFLFLPLALPPLPSFPSPQNCLDSRNRPTTIEIPPLQTLQYSGFGTSDRTASLHAPLCE